MVICLERGADLHMAQLMPLSLAPVKSRSVLPFWYRFTQVVLEKRPLNGCTHTCSCNSISGICCCCAVVDSYEVVVMHVTVMISMCFVVDSVIAE